MSDYVSVPGIVGADNKVPLWNPEGRFSTWDMNEIYLGANGEGKYVPKVGDLVFQKYETEVIIYEVESIDETTYIAKFKQKIATTTTDDISTADQLLGVGPGTQSDTFRVLVDKSVTPYKVTVDRRCWVSGNLSTYAKVFFGGTDLSDESLVISMLYDSSNSFIGTQIPLELTEGIENNISRRVVKEFRTKADLKDNDIVVVVFYSKSGHQVSKRQCLVENTAFIATTDQNVKYITGISLKTSFLSASDSSKIIYPINVPVESMNLIGVVEYSDGSKIELPVDGTKFKMSGFHNFVGTVPMQELDLSLKYTLSVNEISYMNSQVSDERFIAKSYKASVQKADGAYGVKLFAFPMWVDAITGYRMEYFIFNLDRAIHERVTPYVRIQENTAGFQPRNYGVAQDLNVSIDLSDVNAAYKSYRHNQTLTVTLVRPGTEAGTTYSIAFDPTQNPLYGPGNQMWYEYVNTNLKRLDMTMGLTSYTEWLDRLYYRTKPLVNVHTELVPPVPTHFNLIIGTETFEFKVEEWTNTVIAGTDLYPGMSVFIEFFKRTPVNDIFLSIAGVSAKQIVTP